MAQANGRQRKSATIGDPAKIPLPVDISITADGKGLWVNTFMDGMTRYFDLSDPEAPKQTYEKQTGRQVNMISQSWDGKRVYITSEPAGTSGTRGARTTNSSCARFKWDGKELKPAFEVDFTKEKLGRPHHMKFSAKAAAQRADAAEIAAEMFGGARRRVAGGDFIVCRAGLVGAPIRGRHWRRKWISCRRLPARTGCSDPASPDAVLLNASAGARRLSA